MGDAVPEVKSVITDPEVCGGAPSLDGTRIRVSDVVVAYDHHGLTPEEIAGEFPSLRLQDIHAALAYYHSRPDEIREEIRKREQKLAERD